MHCRSKTWNEEEIVDDDFKIGVEDSYRLERVVEMYQRIETLKNEDEHG